MSDRERLLLALDGSTGVCSTALLTLRSSRDTPAGSTSMVASEEQPGRYFRFELLSQRLAGDGRAQAQLLLRLSDEMLGQVGRGSENLDAVVVGKGPGTFTGVRVTVATARALSLALGIPVLGVSTLAALAASVAESAAGLLPVAGEAPKHNVPPQGLEMIVPVVDARRRQVFYASYASNAGTVRAGSGAGTWIRQGDYGVCDHEMLGEVIGSARTLIVGDETLRPKELPPNAHFMGRHVAAEHLMMGQEYLLEPGPLPEGTRLGAWLETALAAERSTRNDASTIACTGASGTPEAVRPIYVRSPDADVHITRMKDPWADR
jgi:tRNA threonylcarbamoyl adenosine modification protein YeaZ